MKTKFLIVISALIIGFPVWLYPIGASAAVNVKVKVEKGVSLRDLARTYLGNPDEWQMILKYNGFNHPTELRSGMTLTIPVAAFERTMAVLDQGRITARQANMEGAGVLATREMGESIRLARQAMDLKKDGKLEDAEASARQAVRFARTALAEARKKKIRSVSAVLSQKEGNVQNRKPAQPLWTEAGIDHELIEQERVRTLSNSRAGILFVDESLIHMDENSLAVIGEMKENLIKKAFKAEVTVLRGDVLVHLSSLGGRKEFAVNAPGVGTKIRSKKFRASRDKGQVTRIANYDGEIDVEANRGKVTIKKDEGTKIESGKKPEAPRKLLQPPVLKFPAPNQVLFSPMVDFQWEDVKGAGAYKLEIAADRKFTSMVSGIRSSGTRYQWNVPRKGIYYCRIHTIDNDEFSGPYSETIDFFADIDTLPPFLTLYTPEGGKRIFSADLVVKGVAEQDADVFINEEPVQIDVTGEFQHRLSLVPGEHEIHIVAIDRAGNRSRIDRKIVCLPDERLIELETPDQIISNVNQITIKGKIKPNVTVTIDGRPVALPREFTHVFTLPEGHHSITFSATSSAGTVQTLPVNITVDTRPPDIRLDDYAGSTKQDVVQIAGSVSEAADLDLDGVRIDVEDKGFQLSIPLSEGGNVFILTAVDHAGNRTEQTIQVLRDTHPPKFGTSTCSPPSTTGGAILTCRADAVDTGVGLARTGIFEVQVSQKTTRFQGVLTWNRAANRFEGSVFVPPGIKGNVQLRHIRIRDRLGNESVYSQ